MARNKHDSGDQKIPAQPARPNLPAQILLGLRAGFDLIFFWFLVRMAIFWVWFFGPTYFFSPVKKTMGIGSNAWYFVGHPLKWFNMAEIPRVLDVHHPQICHFFDHIHWIDSNQSLSGNSWFPDVSFAVSRFRGLTQSGNSEKWPNRAGATWWWRTKMGPRIGTVSKARDFLDLLGVAGCCWVGAFKVPLVNPLIQLRTEEVCFWFSDCWIFLWLPSGNITICNAKLPIWILNIVDLPPMTDVSP